MGPINFATIIPIGFEQKNVPWPDHSNCNDPEWVRNITAVDMEQWMEGS